MRGRIEEVPRASNSRRGSGPHLPTLWGTKTRWHRPERNQTTTMIWRKVHSNCAECGVSVGKIRIGDGRIVVEQYGENWGTWRHVRGTSEMQVICKTCQRRLAKQGGE
jgi:hypothetical protein